RSQPTREHPRWPEAARGNGKQRDLVAAVRYIEPRAGQGAPPKRPVSPLESLHATSSVRQVARKGPRRRLRCATFSATRRPPPRLALIRTGHPPLSAITPTE